MNDIALLLTDPGAWLALASLIVMEIVLGIDNLVFVSILTNRLPPAQQKSARRIGITLALVLRLALLASIAWLVGLTAPVFDLGLTGPDNGHGEPTFETAFSWRDLILIAGGGFLVWKATTEIHETVEGETHGDGSAEPSLAGAVVMSFGSAIVQILFLDIVFSLDSILTAVGMTDHLPVMFIAVIVAVFVMLMASGPLSRFIAANPSVVMLALGFLLMIGMVLLADGFGVHVPKGYVYAAMAFSGFVEGLNLWSRKRRKSRRQRAIAANGSRFAERREMIRHIVMFSLKDRSEVELARQRLMQLATIPGARSFEVRENLKADLYGNAIDLVVYSEFEDLEALAEWKRHPAYDATTALVRPMRELRFAADIEE